MWIPTINDIRHRDGSARDSHELETLQHPFYVIRRSMFDQCQYFSTDESEGEGNFWWSDDIVDACYFATPSTVLTLVQGAVKIREHMRQSLDSRNVEIARVQAKRKEIEFDEEVI